MTVKLSAKVYADFFFVAFVVLDSIKRNFFVCGQLKPCLDLLVRHVFNSDRCVRGKQHNKTNTTPNPDFLA